MEDLKKELVKKKKDELVDMIVSMKEKLLSTNKQSVKKKIEEMGYKAVAILKDGRDLHKVDLRFNLESGEAVVVNIRKGLSHLIQRDVMKEVVTMTLKQDMVKED